MDLLLHKFLHRDATGLAEPTKGAIRRLRSDRNRKALLDKIVNVATDGLKRVDSPVPIGIFVRCVCEALSQRLITDRPKCYEPKQRFDGSACAKALVPIAEK
jgi:hypothetical protein